MEGEKREIIVEGIIEGTERKEKIKNKGRY